MEKILWCGKCGRLNGSGWHQDREGNYCGGSAVEWAPELPPMEGWTTTPPEMPDPGVKEKWWFYGVTLGSLYYRRDPLRLELVENIVIGSSSKSGSQQRIWCDSDLRAVSDFIGYWRRFEFPPLPPAFTTPWKM